MDPAVTLKQVGFRDGTRGNVHDTYELNVYHTTVLVIRHYVEEGIEEVPLSLIVPDCGKRNFEIHG